MLRQHVWLWLLGFSGWLGAERAVNLFDSSCKFSSVCTLWLVADQMKFANACSIVLSMSITTRFVMATVWCFFQRILYSAAARLSKVHGQFCERVHVSWSWEFRAVDIFFRKLSTILIWHFSRIFREYSTLPSQNKRSYKFSWMCKRITH